MITGDDIRRLEEEEAKRDRQLLVIDTQQFFEIEIPADMDPEEYLNTDECRAECAALIINQTTDLTIDRIYTKWDSDKEEWTDADT